MTAPCGMSMPVKRSPTRWLVVPSLTSSRSELVRDIEVALCSTSSAPDATRFSKMIGSLIAVLRRSATAPCSKTLTPQAAPLRNPPSLRALSAVREALGFGPRPGQPTSSRSAGAR